MALCKLSEWVGDKAATFVAKVDKPLMSFALAQLDAGAGAVALVSLSRLEHDLVISGEPHKIFNYNQKLREKIGWCSDAPRVDGVVEWVIPLNRRLQRRFYWGDAASGQVEDLSGCFWRMHPEHPLPFFVADQKKP